MENHYIVCGMGHLGHHAVELFRRLGERVTVVTQGTSDDWLRAVQANGVRVLIGDARDRKLLVSAGIEHARALLATTDQDLVNIEIVLDARQLRPDLPLVVRLFDQTLTQQLESSFSLRKVLATSRLSAPSFAAAAIGETVLGSFPMGDALFVIRKLIVDADSPLANLTVRQAGEKHHLGVLACDREPNGVTLLLRPEELLRVGDRVILMGDNPAWKAALLQLGLGNKQRAEARPEPAHAPAAKLGSRFSAARDVFKRMPLTLRLLLTTFAALIILSVLVFHWGMGLSFVDAIYFIVTTVTTVGYGDISPRAASTWLKIYACFVMLLGSAMIATLFSVITDFIVASRFEQMLGRKAIPQSGHTIVVGLGNVGYRIVEELRKVGTSVVAVDRDANGQFVESVGTQVPVIIGDARLPNVLRKAGVAKAHAVIATTENDAVNLSVGLGARLVNPQLRAVIRLFDADFARKVQTSLKVDMALSSSLIAAPTFVASALYTGVQTSFTVGDHLLTIVHRPVGEVWAGRTPGQILEEEQVVILLRRRGLSSAYEPLPEETRLEKDQELIAAIWRKLDPLQVVKY